MASVLHETRQGVSIITLNREEKLNSINREMALLLQQILRECATDKNVRVIYLTGGGKAFCAGQDLAEATDLNAMARILPEQLNPIVSLITSVEKPVVAAVNGVAAGAGANIALCCDIVVASSSASFIQAFTKLGLIPDSGGTYMLPRLVGWQKASAMMMLGEKINALEAESTGMIYKAIPDERFSEESLKIADTLAAMPPRALALTKQALQRSEKNSFQQQLLFEEDLQSIAGRTKDYAEAVRAFMEKRKPQFTGE